MMDSEDDLEEGEIRDEEGKILIEALQQIKKLKKQLEETEKEKRKLRMQLDFPKSKAKIIGNVYNKLPRQETNKGLVVSGPHKYNPPNRANARIKSYMWIYCNKYGLIRSLNHPEKKPVKLATWYEFKFADERCKKGRRGKGWTHMQAGRTINEEEIRHQRKTILDENGGFKIYASFKIDGSILFGEDDMGVVLEDKFLNRVLLRWSFIEGIRKNKKVEEFDRVVELNAEVKLRKYFMEEFEQDPNTVIFEVTEVLQVL